MSKAGGQRALVHCMLTHSQPISVVTVYVPQTIPRLSKSLLLVLSKSPTEHVWFKEQAHGTNELLTVMLSVLRTKQFQGHRHTGRREAQEAMLLSDKTIGFDSTQFWPGVYC